MGLEDAAASDASAEGRQLCDWRPSICVNKQSTWQWLLVLVAICVWERLDASKSSIPNNVDFSTNRLAAVLQPGNRAAARKDAKAHSQTQIATIFRGIAHVD